MIYALGVVAFILGIVASIALHEIGHLVPAKKFGAIVPKYMIGFGPTLWSFKRGGTEYGVKVFLLGGFVSILGMFGPPKPTTVIGTLEGRRITARAGAALDEHSRAKIKITGAQDARLASLGEIPAGQEHRAFYRLSVGKRIIIMLGGPLMNLFLSFLCVVIAAGGIGITAPSTTLDRVQPCITKDPNGVCAPGAPVGPAFAAGLKPGDKIVELSGKKVSSWDEVRVHLARLGDPVSGKVQRAGQLVDFTLTPVSFEGRYVAGVVSKIERQRLGAVKIFETEFQLLKGTAQVVVALPQAVWKVGKTLVNGEQRDPQGVLSVVGVGRIAGDIASSTAVPLIDRVAALVMLLASLNMALFVFNLIPLLPLDGGHIIGACFEALRRGFHKIRGINDTRPVDMARALPLTQVVIVVLVLMTVLLVAADIFEPIRLG